MERDILHTLESVQLLKPIFRRQAIKYRVLTKLENRVGFPTEGSGGVSTRGWALALAASGWSGFFKPGAHRMSHCTLNKQATESLCHSKSPRETGWGQREGDHKRAPGQSDKEAVEGRAPGSGRGDIPSSLISSSFSPASVAPQVDLQAPEEPILP